MHSCIRNIVGQAPRGSDFFPRPDFIRLIYRRLEAEGHIDISAPRRVGKTAVMHFLEDSPEPGYEFKYIITEAVSDPLEFYERVFDAIKEFRSISLVTKDSILHFLNLIKGFRIMGTGIDVSVKNRNVLEECKSIIKNLSTNGTKVILMIDEFPQTIENILREKGKAEAIKFLYANRELREVACSRFRFLYTGSMGLKQLCSRLEAIDALNTLTTIEMGPLTTVEALKLCESVLHCAKVPFEKSAINHLILRIHWLTPFHIQLILQELIDEIDRGSLMIDCDAVDLAIDRIIFRRNDHFFEHYHIRIMKMFPVETKEYLFIKKVLNTLSVQDLVSKKDIYLLATEQNISEGIEKILNILEYDGYVHEDKSSPNQSYRFTSLLLRLWWRKNMI